MMSQLHPFSDLNASNWKTIFIQKLSKQVFITLGIKPVLKVQLYFWLILKHLR